MVSANRLAVQPRLLIRAPATLLRTPSDPVRPPPPPAAAVVGAEAAFTGLSTSATNKGRPGVVSTVAGVGGVLAVRGERRRAGVEPGDADSVAGGRRCHSSARCGSPPRAKLLLRATGRGGRFSCLQSPLQHPATAPAPTAPQGVALLQSPLDTVGYGLGFAASAFLFTVYLQRVRDTGG